MIGFNMGRFVLLVYMYTRSQLYLRFDSSGTENRDFTGKNVFHGFHGSTVAFTGLPQKQPISRTRDTVKKEGPCWKGAGEGLERGWRAAGEGLERGWRRAGEGLERGWRAAGEGLERGWIIS